MIVAIIIGPVLVHSYCGSLLVPFEDNSYLPYALYACSSEYNATTNTSISYKYTCNGDSNNTYILLTYSNTNCSGDPISNVTHPLNTTGAEYIICDSQQASIEHCEYIIQRTYTYKEESNNNNNNSSLYSSTMIDDMNRNDVNNCSDAISEWSYKDIAYTVDY